MTGVRRALCDCCGVDRCGFTGAFGAPCSVVTSSDCPETLAVEFSFAGADIYTDCNFGAGSPDCQITSAIPAIASTTITVTQDPTLRCLYTGSASISGSWTSNPCSGSGTSYNYTSIDVTLQGHTHLFGSGQITTPCFGHGCTGAICAGICAEFFINRNTGSAYNFGACWFSHCLSDCTVTVPCYSTYANTTPDQTRTWVDLCASPNNDSACIDGNGWSSDCSGVGRIESEPVFTAAIS